MQIEITDEQAAILQRVYMALGHGERGLNEQEKLEVGLGALIDSFDSTQDAAEEQREEGVAIDRAQLMDSIQKTLSPNIGGDVVVQDVQAAPKAEKTFEEWAAEAPTNILVIESKKGDEFDRQSVCALFSNFPKAEWDTELCADMWKTGAAMLREHARGKCPAPGEDHSELDVDPMTDPAYQPPAKNVVDKG